MKAQSIFGINSDLYVVESDGLTPLTRAVASRDIARVKILLEEKANINQKDNSNNDTPLTKASIKGYDEIVELLCEHKADLSIANYFGYFPLKAAARNNHSKVLTILLEQKAAVNQVDKHGSALSYAASEGHEQSVKILLENHADINLQNKWGGTPFNVAVCHNNILSMMQDHQKKIELEAKLKVSL